eukprot:856974-Prymnesium_polylepis.3
MGEERSESSVQHPLRCRRSQGTDRPLRLPCQPLRVEETLEGQRDNKGKQLEECHNDHNGDNVVG